MKKQTKSPRARASAGATMSVEEAADVLGIGRDAAYRGVRAKTIPALRIGRFWRVPRVALDRMLQGEAR